MEFRRFNDITSADMNSDLHIHSVYSDGKDSIEAIVKRAEELGLNEIAITDHIRVGSTYFNQYSSEIMALRKITKLNILVGFEARIKNFKGELDVSRDVAEKAEIKIGSVHRFSIGKKLYAAEVFSQEVAQELELEISLAGIAQRAFNVLGHPGGMCLRNFKHFPLEYFEEMIIACKENSVVFELNSGYHQTVYPQLRSVLKKHNPLVVFGSDAHVVEDIGKWASLLRDI